MSPDPTEKLKRFEEKYRLRFTLLGDEDHDAISAYGAWGVRASGREGVTRSTVLIGPDGRIERTWYGVKADGHAQEVLEAARELRA